MEIYIYDKGEEESNINPNEMTININHDYEGYSEDELEDIKTNIKEYAKSFFDFMDDAEVRFGNECPDCFSRLVDGKCVNEDCPSVMNAMEDAAEKDAETKPGGLEKV